VAAQNEACSACHARDLTGWHGGPHDSAGTGCASCHRAHVSQDPIGSARLQVDTCVSCHARVRLDLQKPFRHPVADGMPGCGACHAPHDSTAIGSLRRPTVNETCYECHAEKRGPFLFEHPPAAEDCGLCHAPHGAIHPAMLTRRGPLLCQQCHSQAGHPSIISTPAGLPGGTPSPLLLAGNCLNCHNQVHGSNHPSGVTLSR
jgi:DmsE family decaheme c-type cytochrome